MNVLAVELDKLFDEVSPLEFYDDIFQKELDSWGSNTHGKYTGIALEIIDQNFLSGKQKVKRYSVTNDMQIIKELCSRDNFCVLAPISYAGKTRKSENARIMYALCIELDNLIVKDGVQEGFNCLLQQFSKRVEWIPEPTYIVASGNGLHLYYQFERGIPLFKNIVQEIMKFKRELTEKIWNWHVTTSIGESIQQESIFQAFRMVGTVTKNNDRVRAFKVGDSVTWEYMNDFVHEENRVTEIYKSNLTLKEAAENYPEWYEKRIEQKQPKGHWTCKRDLYEWWKRRIKEEAVVGHRYYCLMMLSIYAVKCDISEQELHEDCFKFMELFEQKTDNEKNHFTEKDVLDALQSFYDKGLITYPVNSISNRSGIRIEKNKRNYRKREQHIKIVNEMRRFKRDILGELEYKNNGRPNKELEVRMYLSEHPEEKNVSKIARECEVSRNTVYKYMGEKHGQNNKTNC